MLEPKDIKRHDNPNVVIMFKSDDERPGQIITASVHRNQVSHFQSIGWLVSPCYALDIPTPEVTEELLRQHDKGEITLKEKSTLIEEAIELPDKREALLAAAATEACKTNPDEEKVKNYLEGRKRGKRS